VPLTDLQIERYSRQVILPEVGGRGQERLMEARVLVVGAGGLGSTAALYLAAAGIGTLGIADDDRVELANLHRQVLYTMAAVGHLKTDAAQRALARLNPDCRVQLYPQRVGAATVRGLVAAYDVVVDGTDNFPTRFAINDACVELGRPLVAGSVLRFDGQVSTYLGFRDDAPCYRCVFPEPPPPGLYPAAAECGIFGTVAGLIGTIQATEVLKLVVGIGVPLAGRLLIYDAAAGTFREVEVRKAADCASCASTGAGRRAAAG